MNATMEKREEQMQPERTRAGRTYQPNVDIYEKGDELVLLADVPGATADSIDINYENGVLTLQGRVAPRQAPETAYMLREYGVGDFERSFRIGESIDASKIHAEVRAGVLTLHLPKVSAAKARKIEVKAH